MKTAIYIEDGTVQLVITPESEFEKDAMRTFNDQERGLEAKMFRGSFYDCRGGWVRQSTYQAHAGYQSYDTGDNSLILRMVPKKTDQVDRTDGPAVPGTGSLAGG